MMPEFEKEEMRPEDMGSKSLAKRKTERILKLKIKTMNNEFKFVPADSHLIENRNICSCVFSKNLLKTVAFAFSSLKMTSIFIRQIIFLARVRRHPHSWFGRHSVTNIRYVLITARNVKRLSSLNDQVKMLENLLPTQLWAN